MLKSRLPPFFVAVVEEQVHSDRVGLNKRAVLAVTVEVLVGGGADDPRELAQQMHGLSTDETQVSDRAYLISCMFTMDFAFLIFSEMSVESTPKRRVQVTVVVVGVEVVGVKNRPEYPVASFLLLFVGATGQRLNFGSSVVWAVAISTCFRNLSDLDIKKIQNRLLDLEDFINDHRRVGLPSF